MIDISKERYWDLPWSLVDGCTPCSPGCDHCWALAMEKRFRFVYKRGDCLFQDPACGGERINDTRILTHPERLSIPLKRRKPTVYAVWNDLFHETVTEEFIREAHWTIQRCGWHTFLVLTKRPERMVDFFSTRHDAPFLDNVFYSLTVCNQQEADEKIPVFLQVSGKKFFSIEPMLGPVDLVRWMDITYCGTGFSAVKGRAAYDDYRPKIDAIILGGETGPGARPIHPDWVRSVRDQCAAAGVPFFFKSWGAWKPCDTFHEECDGHKSTAMRLTGEIVTDESPIWKDKSIGGTDQGFWKAGSNAGRLLDGRTHDDLPWRPAP